MSKGKAKTVLIDSHVSLRQCKLAIDALHAHLLKKEQTAAETELLPGKEQHIWLQVAVKKMQSEKKLKPSKIPIVHPLVDPRTSAVCLITKDPQREYKDLLEANGIKFISRVVGLTKLRGKFKPFEARRMLLKENGMFLADERVIPLLPGLLGSKWFEAKKQPIPVCLTRKDLKGEIERAISSTYMHLNQGTCTSIKIATTSHSPAQALANLQKALPAVVENLKGGWENVQSLHLKTSESAALPIWTCGLGLDGEESRWDGLVAKEKNSDEDQMDVDDTVVVAKETAKDKGTKRPSEEEVQDGEKPKKKVKGVQPTPSTDVDLPASAKKRRKSTLSAEPIPIVIDSPAPPPKLGTAEVDVPTKKKRKTKVGTSDLLAVKPLPSSIDPLPTDIEADADIDTEATERPVKPKKAKRKSKLRASLGSAGEDLPIAIAELSVSAPKTEAVAPIVAVQTIPKKKKARPSAVNTDASAAVVAEPVDAMDVESLNANVPAKKKRQIRKEREAASSSVDDVAEAVPTVPDGSVKKKKPLKEREALAAATEDDIDVALPESPLVAAQGDSEKKKKKKQSKAVAGEAAPTSVLPSTESTIVGALAKDDSAKMSRKEKKKARASMADADAGSPAPVTPKGITKGELKQKRSGEGGERKKIKMVKKSGKSAKDAILGRKAGQS